MQLCRFFVPGPGSTAWGRLVGHTVYDVSATGDPRLSTLASLIQASQETPVIILLSEIDRSTVPSYAYAALDREPNPEEPYLLAPVDQQEVWAAGGHVCLEPGSTGTRSAIKGYLRARIRRPAPRTVLQGVGREGSRAQRLDRRQGRQPLERSGAGTGTDPEPRYGNYRLHGGRRRQ